MKTTITQLNHSDSNSCVDSSTTSSVISSTSASLMQLAPIQKATVTHEIVFVDTTLPNWQSLIKNIDPGSEIITLDPLKNGMQQIADALNGKVDITAIHIMSHGGEGYLVLGNTIVSSYNLVDYQSSFAKIRAALSSDADILLYGCDVAKGEVGTQFVSKLAQLTGSDIAASSNDTGVSGDWILEYQSGTVETSAFAAPEYKFDLTTIKVSNLNDSGAGSLRQAVLDATGNDVADTIVFDPALFASGAATITLTSGALDVGGASDADAFTIVGPGENLLTISGNNTSRIFLANTVNTSATSISGMTLTNGSDAAQSNYGGGAILSYYSGSLTLDHIIIKNSIASNYGGGGAVNFGTDNGNLIISNSTFDGNSTTTTGANGHGGGIAAFAKSHSISISNSTISNNTNINGFYGGGASFGGTGSTVTITNTTIAGNSAGSGTAGIGGGGGIIITSPTIFITNSTIVNNAWNGGSAVNNGGGGLSLFNGGTAVLKNNIIANNTSTNTVLDDTDVIVTHSGIMSGSNNLIPTTVGLHYSATNTTTSTQTTLGSALGSLAFNGGAVKTIAITSGSNAIGNGTTSGAPTTDARGFGRGASNDIGAFEFSDNDSFSFAGVVSPHKGAIDVPLNYDLVIEFGKTVSAVASKNILIKRVSDNAVLETIAANDSAKVTFSSGLGGTNSKVTINPSSNLAGTTAYYIEIDNGAFQDGSSNTFAGISGNSSWTFTSETPPAPTVTSVSSAHANGSFTAGEVISISVTFDQAVDVVGTPQLTLETGTTDRTINFTSGTGTNTLTFNYTVQAGDTTADLDYISTTALTLNSGSIKVAGGSSDAVLTLATPGASGSLGANKAIVIDTTAPNAPSAPDMTSGTDMGSSSTDNNTNDTTPTFTGTAESGSTVTLYDTDGTTVIGTGIATGGIYSITTSALSAGSHTVTAKATDAAGNTGTASTELNISIDTSAPTVSSVGVPSDGTYKIGQTLDLTVDFGENVHLTGSPYIPITLNTGGTVNASYFSGDGTSTLVFRYTIASGNLDADGIAVGASINLNGGTLKDTAGNDATLTLNSVGSTANVLVDGIAPTVTSIDRVSAASTNATSVQYTVTFSESVTGVDTSDFSLTTTGGVAGTIAAISGSGTTYTVTVNSITGDGTMRLDLKNSGTGIADVATNAIATGYTSGQVYTLDTTAPSAPSTPDMTSGTDMGNSDTDNNTNDTTPTFTGTAESGSTVTLYDTDGTTVIGTGIATGGNYSITTSALSAGSHTITAKATDAAGNTGTASTGLNISIDTSAPTVSSVGVPSDGTYKIGQTLDLTVDFGENVHLTGSPYIPITLNTGGTVNASYFSGDGTSTLVFRYTIASGNLDADGIAVGASINLNGGTLKDTAGNDATLTLNSVGSTANVLVDGIAPTVTSIDRVSAASTNATSVQYTVTFSENVAGVDTSDFALTTTGGVAGTIAAISGSGTTYTVTVNSITGDGTMRLDLKNSGTGIADVATNAIATGYTSGQVYTLDTTAPSAPSTPDMTAGTDTGISSTDNITANTTPTFTGTAEANSTVKLYDTDEVTLLGTGTADGAGNWSITSATLTNGSHTIKASATDVAGNVGVLSSGLSVSIASPTITSATYDAATGILSVTGSGMITNDLIDLSKLSLVGESGASYTLTTPSVNASSPTAFSITLNAADKLAINGLLNKDGLQAVSGTLFNLEAALNWDSTSSSGADLTGNAITVSNVTAPTITSATYDATTHILTVTGTGLVKTLGATNDVTVSTLTITGEGGATRALTTTGNVEVTSATSFAVTLAGADQTAVEALFNKNGTASTNGTTYNLAASDDWNSVITGGNIADASSPITVTNVPVPTIASSSYNASTGVLTVTGTGFASLTGANNDILANKFSLQGEGGASYTLNTTSNVEVSSATSFTLTLSAADRLGVNLIMNKNGTSSTSANTYNLIAAEDWNTGADTAVVIADLTGNGVTVSNVVAPTVTSATYNVVTGVLVVTGNNFLSLTGANNDIVASNIRLLGQGALNYNLTDTPNVDITSNTSFTLTVSANDKAALALRMNKNGTSATDSTTYNIGLLDDWNAGADIAVNIADLFGNGVTVAGVSPTTSITASSFSIDAGTSSSDFVTNVATQTISGTLSANLLVGESVEVSTNNGSSWSTATAAVGQNSWSLAGATLSSGTQNLRVRVVDIYANSGPVYTQSYTLDTTRPTVNGTISFSDSLLAIGETSTMFLSFSEAVSGLTSADFSVPNGSLSNLSTSDGGITWTATLTPNANVNDVSNVITLNGAGYRDTAGNSSSSNTTSLNFAIDTVRPTVAITMSDIDLGIIDTALVTFTFNEPVSGFSNANITLPVTAPMGSLSTVTSLDGGTTWTATYTPPFGVLDTSNLISVNTAGIIDAVGNAGVAVINSPNFTINTINIAPSLGGISTGLSTSDTTRILPFTNVTVSDPDIGALVTAAIGLDHANKGSFTANSLALSGFFSNDGGITYEHTAASPEVIQAAIRALVFEPNPSRLSVGTSDVTTFTIMVRDQYSATDIDMNTTLTISNSNSPPTDITLSDTLLLQSEETNATVGLLSAVDRNIGDTHTFTLGDVNALNSNSLFTIVGNSLKAINPAAMTEGDYRVDVQVTDAAGMQFLKNFTVHLEDDLAPYITSIETLRSPRPTVTTGSFIVKFNESVTGVTLDDFFLSSIDGVLANLSHVTALSGNAYRVYINQITGPGNLTLNLKNSGTGISDLFGNSLPSSMPPAPQNITSFSYEKATLEIEDATISLIGIQSKDMNSML